MQGFEVVDPVMPALTCSAQSTYLTGKSPSEHGIVANGWYDRELNEHHFWKQSNQLVGAKKVWEYLKEKNKDFTCANLFWWYNMHSTVDYSITPRPLYRADGLKTFDVHTQPMNLREQVKGDIGEFPFHGFWGPRCGMHHQNGSQNQLNGRRKNILLIFLSFIFPILIMTCKIGPKSCKNRKCP